MFKRLHSVRSVVSMLPHTILHEAKERKIDETFELPNKFVQIINSRSFWDQVEVAHDCFDFICKCIGTLESDSATMSTAYAALLNVQIHIDNMRITFGSKYEKIHSEFIRHWQRVYSPVHSLLFMCDPLFNNLRKIVAKKYPRSFINMGNDLVQQCHHALELISNDNDHHKNILEEYMSYCVAPSSVLDELKSWHPRLYWGQLKSEYPTLGPLLSNLYRAPASTSGVERNHKVNKRVMSTLRCRLSDKKVEKQVSVCHNSSQLTRSINNKRDDAMHVLLSRSGEGELGGNTNDLTDLEPCNEQSVDQSVDVTTDNVIQDWDEMEKELEVGGSDLERCVWEIEDPKQILDDFLFNADE